MIIIIIIIIIIMIIITNNKFINVSRLFSREITLY